jgi:hypothetical protein
MEQPSKGQSTPPQQVGPLIDLSSSMLSQETADKDFRETVARERELIRQEAERRQREEQQHNGQAEQERSLHEASQRVQEEWRQLEEQQRRLRDAEEEAERQRHQLPQASPAVPFPGARPAPPPYPRPQPQPRKKSKVFALVAGCLGCVVVLLGGAAVVAGVVYWCGGFDWLFKGGQPVPTATAFPPTSAAFPPTSEFSSPAVDSRQRLIGAWHGTFSSGFQWVCAFESNGIYTGFDKNQQGQIFGPFVGSYSVSANQVHITFEKGGWMTLQLSWLSVDSCVLRIVDSSNTKNIGTEATFYRIRN